MASHVRAPREIQNALQWLADSDQDQVKEAAALIAVQHRSALMTTLSRSFCADDASASSNPWAGFTSDPPASSASTSAKADVGQVAPPPPPESQSPFPAPAEPKHLKFHGVNVRSIHCIACREPCQLCNLAFCGFSSENPSDSHFIAGGSHTCKKCYRENRDRKKEEKQEWSDWKGGWESDDWWGRKW